MAHSPKDMAVELLKILHHDREHKLLKIDRYLHGEHEQPYMPDNADLEYRLYAQRCVTNVIPFVVNTPVQALYVDSFRRGRTAETTEDTQPREAREQRVQPEWEHFQKSRLDARQSSVYRGALSYGHSFVVTEMKNDEPISRGLSALHTAALYEDAANDCDPYAALTVTKWADPVKEIKGEAWLWDKTRKYKVTFESLLDLGKGFTIDGGVAHGAEECPVTRFAASVDLEGRTMGVVWPMITLQNRINQTVFDLLIVQSFASFKVRTISGMAPPMEMIPVDENGVEVKNPDLNRDKVVDYIPRLDSQGRPIPANINLNARRVFWAEDEDTKFGTLDETPLDGFIKSIEMAFRHMAALSQTPPHHILGEIANLSAEALTAAETALSRKIEEFKASFGESWERVFRIAAQMGEFEGADDFSGEVMWRDMEQKSLAQAGDALGKLAESLGIPKRGLWSRVPGVTANELASWEDLRETEDGELALAASVRRASAFRPTVTDLNDRLGA